MSTLGVLVVSVCGMKHLPQCLESVHWADAVMVLHVGPGKPVVDSNRSLSVVIRTVRSASELKEISKEIRTDWVLRLWGEERVGAELKEQLWEVSKAGTERISSAYRIPIRSRLLGCWVRGSLWGPSPARRFSRSVEHLSPEWWNGKEKKTGIPPETLNGWIEDYSLADLSGGVEQIHHVSNVWAERVNAEGWSHSPTSMALRPLGVFFGLLWMHGLVWHGLAGLTLSTMAAYATLLTGAKIWESRNVS